MDSIPGRIVSVGHRRVVIRIIWWWTVRSIHDGVYFSGHRKQASNYKVVS